MTHSMLPSHSHAMPRDCPSYPPGPYPFKNQEFLNIVYRTDPEALGRVVHDNLT